MQESFVRLIATVLVSTVLIGILAFYVGISKNTRKEFVSIIIKKTH